MSKRLPADTRLVEAELATPVWMNNPEHVLLVRELAAYHCLCPLSFQFGYIPSPMESGEVVERTKNSAIHWSRVFEWPWAILKAELKPWHVCLDAGGGHAVFQYALACRVKHVTNVDLNRESLDNVRDVAAAMFAPIQTVIGRIDALEYPDGFFDRVFCLSVLEHTGDWHGCLTEILRVLKPGGIAVVSLDMTVNADECTSEDKGVTKEDMKEFLDGFPVVVGRKPIIGRKLDDVPEDGGRVVGCLCLKIKKEGDDAAGADQAEVGGAVGELRSDLCGPEV